MDEELAAFKAERNKALMELDLEWARRQFPNVDSNKLLLVALHKARVEVTELPEKERRISMKWLKSRLLGRKFHAPWPLGDELPD